MQINRPKRPVSAGNRIGKRLKPVQNDIKTAHKKKQKKT